MCGICGYFNWNNRDALDRMLKRMVHRGPDEEGKHVEPGLALGVRRLSIIAPAGGHQSAANETKTIRVVLNGEIYNYRELRDELIRKGHRFAARSDTEVIVHLYEEEEDLREMVGDLLSEPSIRRRGYLDPTYVQWLITEHNSRRRNFSDQIFAVLALELWLRQFESRSYLLRLFRL